MKYVLIFLLGFSHLISHGQATTTEFDGHKWEAPYHLPAPKDWGIERFLIPISFAPSISYKGVEDIRFAPGWANSKSEEYWTYAFLWYLDGKVNMDEKIMAGNLKAYYTGLFNINTDSARRAAVKVIPVTTSFKKTATATGDLETYTGVIEMMDYMQLKPVTLNCKAHLRFCSDENRTIVFYELSPQPFTHTNWVSLDQLWTGFACKKN